MIYTKFQKFISSFLIFSLLFGITFRVPFFDFLASASWDDYYDIVSILVDEKTYSDTSSEIKRYSKDITNVLENTKVVVLPFPDDASTYDIASINESLYYEWYKWLSDVDFESRLVWTVLIWNIQIPTVHKNNEVSKTILPYTDFDDKSYIYNTDTQKYEYNKDNVTWVRSEIWHWVISPNTWNYDTDIDAIKDYFDKNHDYYTWKWFYELENNSTNWNQNEWYSDTYEPYVFYFDSFRESKALNYNSYVWYELYLSNKEDIIYNRYTKELADKLKQELLWSSTESLGSLAKKIDPTLSDDLINSLDNNLEWVPDIQTRTIINETVKKFIQVISPWAISDMRKNVYNAWRYNYEDRVNVDFIPYLISVLDIVNDELIKEITDDFESKMDWLIKSIPWSIVIPVSYKFKNSQVEEVYENYLFWKKASDITYAWDCSFYRGSTINWWQLVEANRGTNIYNIEPDKNTLSVYGNICFSNLQSWKSLDWLWWRNSPFNLNQTESAKWNLVLNQSDYKWAIVPLYDIKWSKEIYDSSKNPSISMCYNTNLILADRYEYWVWNWETSTWENTYKLPSYQTSTLRTSVPWWQCITDTNSTDKYYPFSLKFEQHVSTLTAGYCEKNSIYLDGVLVKEVAYNEACWWDSCECSWTNTRDIVNNIEDILDGLLVDESYDIEESSWIINRYDYKTISDSHMFHKSPTSDELKAQIESMVTPSLAVDKDRYIDFLLSNWSFAKINYPYLFRIKFDDISDLTIDKVSIELDRVLDQKSQEFKNITWLSLDLKTYLKQKWSKKLYLDWEEKDISYYDMLVFAIYWNNLSSVSAKYWFVFENYLSSQLNTQNSFFLPKWRSQYEIAYLGSSWNASNMYIWLDPNSKSTNPYSDIISKNQDISTKILWLNINWSETVTNEALFKCAPPEWVPIWEWIPAIMCRLWDMLPPTIKISDWACWPSLLSSEEKEEFEICNWDVNKNWVNDCVESKLPDWNILLESDSNKYSYNKNAQLIASIKWSDWKTLTYINWTNINFELVRVEAKIDENKDISETNKKIIYDSSIKDEVSIKNLNNYLYFKDFTVPTSLWVSKYWINFKNKDINVYLKAKINISDSNKSQILSKESNLLKIEVRGESLTTTTYNLNDSSNLNVNQWNQSVLANDNQNIFLIDWNSQNIDSILSTINNNSKSNEKLVFKIDNLSKIGTSLPNSYPLIVELYSWNNLVKSSSIDNINWFVSLFSISKSWTYNLKIKDNSWKFVEKRFEVMPLSPHKLDINLWANYLQTNWSISTNYVTILDKYNNPVSWNFYDLKMEVSGNNLVFVDNWKDNFSTSTYEWYKIFRLKSLNKLWESNLKVSLYDLDGNVLLSNTKKITVLDSFSLNTKSLMGDIKIWGWTYKYQIEVRDSLWKIINNLNSRVYMKVNSSYLDLQKPYFDIIDWVAIVEFKTKNLAWKNIPIELQIEWFWEIFTKSLDILPWIPMKMDMVVSKFKIEANGEDYSQIWIELKDIYNNLVFTDNSTTLDLEILPEYRNLINSTSYTQKVKDGKANFKIYSTLTPWIWYFKIKTTPTLYDNKFSITDDSWTLDISWVWEVAWKIESFYVWNKSKIENKYYNSIYTTLLWSNYWDIDQKDYLAWSLIFEKTSKALAVTSIVNNPYLYNNVFSVWKNGAFTKLFSESDLSQDIDLDVAFKNDNLYLDVFNNSLNTKIWEAYYIFPNDSNLEVCEDDFNSCINYSKSGIYWKSLDSNFSFYVSWWKLILKDNSGKTYLEIDKSWKIYRKSSLDFLLKNSSSKHLEIILSSWNEEVALLWLNLVNWSINISRDILTLDTKINSSKNSVLIYMDSSLYWTYSNWKWENESLVIYYNDPFWSETSLNWFSKWNNFWYENFENNWGLWWSKWNKTLLSFSSWRNVWESLKENMSFSSINIWDPLVSLKKIKKQFNWTNIDKKFDSTIWDLLSNESWIDTYQIFDYNNDSRVDVLLVKNDWYIKLLENVNTSSRFRDMWDLAYIIDLWNYELLKTWDFTWDWYDDIFFVGEDWDPYLLNNINKDFSRLSLKNKFDLKWRIIRAESFDMDNDWITDIVTLDDEGSINIFYWNLGSSNPTFTKLNLSDDYGVKLSSQIRKDSWFIYFDWLYQIDSRYDNTDLINSNKDYLENLRNSLWTWSESVSREIVDTELANSFIFEQISYSKNNNVDIDWLNWLINLPSTIEQTTFIKSEYSDAAWIKYEKIYTDRNWWFLKSWDIVDIQINITNKSWWTKRNIAYIEDSLEYFNVDFSSVTNSKNLPIKIPNNSYDFLFDGFSLWINENFSISYSWEVKPIKYSYMQVWLFEKWEAGDDLYWDVLLKDSPENCWDPVEIFRSVSTRLYSKWLKNPSCDDSTLPEELSKNTLDSDWDGIPDYIENLTTNNDARKEYSQDVLNNLFTDSDWDGIPDDEDNFNSSNWFQDALSSVDSWLDNIQNFLNWLSCWFNNGSCISMPLNWAPLAPWNDPTFMWYPIWDWLYVWEWLPVFSSLTWLQTSCGTSPCCLPTVWPVSPLAYVPGPTCWPPSAWWYLWTWAPTNTFRLFVTPTLTWWIWMAACFWWPAIVAGYSNMPWISPLFPWWNCIVIAKPLLKCSNDWSEWAPESTWYPVYWSDFWVINWNCSIDVNQSLDSNYANNYYNYITGKWSYSSLWSINEAVSDHNSNISWPLFTIWAESWTPVSVTLDTESWNFDFSDITKIAKQRIQAFPWFLMNWVTRQIEEIVNKLTDFPTLFIILPDFSWIYDTDLDWQTNKANWLKNSWNKDAISNQTIDIDTSGIDNETVKWYAEKAKQYNSWIKEAYEFIGSLPLVKIEQSQVEISLPWISLSEIDKTIFTRKSTLESWKAEVSRASNSWTLWATCNFSDPQAQQRCLDNNSAWEKLLIDSNALVNSLESNLEVLKSYKEIPEQINKLLNTKEKYLEQILCNVETISYILWWRIWKNGERFKAWVELFILIKAILKSWQLLIDVFVEYEQECKECKNERQDLMTFVFELISMIIPEIPVIEFPKWPDIIVDLHNIRAWINVLLPEFRVTSRPILLPELPNLYLPDAPNVNIVLPDLPVLPELVIPELPDLPTWPTVELPDLPPPPTLPKMLSALEAILDILKLVTKAMCILKSSPFIPEWRAWDQIAFLTERNWYLPTDFLSLSSPHFSFPWIDAIKVTTYVNLEFEVDFITELARQVAMPINEFTSDFTSLFDIDIADLDFRYVTPSEINVNLWNLNDRDKKIVNLVSSILIKNLIHWYDYIQKNKDITISNEEFKKEIWLALSSESISWDPRFDELRDLWNNVNKYTYSWEDKLIQELKDNNFNKFESLKDIINTEIIKNKEFKNKLNDSINNPIKKVSFNNSSSVDYYNSILDKYNSKTFESTSNLLNFKEEDSYWWELKEIWNSLLENINTSLSNYSNSTSKNILLLSANTTWSSQSTNNSWEQNSCTYWWKSNWDYSYVYEWIYILEWNRSYRLFDYKDELLWNETTQIIDFDLDGDEDLLHFANNKLYLKESLDKKSDKSFLNENPIILESNDNRFLNSDNYISSVNNLRSTNWSSWIIDLSFSWKKSINNYRVSFYTVIDKFLNENNTNYSPVYRKKSIIDWISWAWEINLLSDTDLYKEYKDLVFLDKVWNLNWVQIETDEFINIRNDINNWNVVSVNNWTKIYSWDNSMVLKYTIWSSWEIKSIIVPKNRHIEVKNTLNIVWINWDWFIRKGNKMIYSWVDIRKLIWKPLLFWTKISYIWNNSDVRDDSYVELSYYDWSIQSIDFQYISDWELYNLWYNSQKYLISTPRNNDLYYAKVSSFKNGINSTMSNQVLLSPQIHSDSNSPDINLSKIRVPVYQKQRIDLTSYIYEDTWIKEAYIDFDLSVDSSWDWNTKNDNDSSNMNNLNFIIVDSKIYVDVWPFNQLYDKKIWLVIRDINNNIWYKEIKFEIYPPIPNINDYIDEDLFWSLDEKLDDEPVNVYRVRWWMVSKLSTKNGDNSTLTNDWDFTFKVWENSSWIKVFKSWVNIANINEKTWKIDIVTNDGLLDELENIILDKWSWNYTISVLTSNDTSNKLVYPKIILKDTYNEVFYETIKVDWKSKINIVNNYSNLDNSWLFFRLVNDANYSYYLLPDNATYNAWSLVVYRSNNQEKEPLFTVFTDWRITSLNSNYILKYSSYNDYVSLILHDKVFNRDIASVLYKIDSDYIIK